MSSPDVIVIGGGVMGCAIALRLAQRGASVVVLERSVPGAEASSVAAGILAPLIEHGDADVATRLGIAGREGHARLAEELRGSHGIDVGFRRTGAMMVALDEAGTAAMGPRAHAIRSAGAEVEALGAEEARRREPGLSPTTRAALDLPEEGQVEPPVLLRALAIAAERAGARFRTGAFVREVRMEGGRARGVVTDAGLLEGGHVVAAAGSWTPRIPGLPAPASAVRPIRGQVVHCELRLPLVRRVLFGGGGYVVPRPDGRIVCGATMEDEGYAKTVTMGGVAEVIGNATRLVPGLARATLTGHAVNFRPSSPDELPLIGPAGPEGLWLATGHHRNGILLAPVTAELIAEQITGAEPSFAEHAALDPRRFTARGRA